MICLSETKLIIMAIIFAIIISWLSPLINYSSKYLSKKILNIKNEDLGEQEQ